MMIIEESKWTSEAKTREDLTFDLAIVKKVKRQEFFRIRNIYCDYLIDSPQIKITKRAELNFKMYFVNKILLSPENMFVISIMKHFLKPIIIFVSTDWSGFLRGRIIFLRRREKSVDPRNIHWSNV